MGNREPVSPGTNKPVGKPSSLGAFISTAAELFALLRNPNGIVYFITTEVQLDDYALVECVDIACTKTMSEGVGYNE